MTAPQKANTFYKTAIRIFDFVVEFMAEEDSDWTLYSVDENCLDYDDYYSRNRNTEFKRVSKWHKSLKQTATARFHNWIISAALNAVFMSESAVPSFMERGYRNELSANRFTYISGSQPAHKISYLGVMLEEDGMPLSHIDPRLMKAPISKVQMRLLRDASQEDPKDTFNFIVWTGNRAESVERARKVFYHMLGYIPFFHVYPRMYGKSTGIRLLEQGLHEDNILQGTTVDIPDDVLDLSHFNAQGRLMRNYTDPEQDTMFLVTKVAEERPDYITQTEKHKV